MLTPKKLGLMTTLASVVTFLSTSAFAQPFGGAMKAATNEFDVKSFAMIGASIAIGLGAMGGALGQGKAAAAALEGIARNPGAQSKIFTPMLLSLALIESLVLFAWAMAFLLQNH